MIRTMIETIIILTAVVFVLYVTYIGFSNPCWTMTQVFKNAIGTLQIEPCL